MTRSTFNAPEPRYKKEPDKAYSSRLDKTQEAHKRVNFSYNPDSWLEQSTDARERANIELQRQFSDLVAEQLVTIHRVLLKPGQFERESGEIDNKVTSAIVYVCNVSIMDERARKQGFEKIIDSEIGVGQVTFTIGRYLKPIVEPTSFDRSGNITNARIKEYHWIYFIEDNKKTLDGITKRYGKPTKPPKVCISAITGESPYTNSFSMIEETDFYECKPVKDIIAGNRMGLPVSAYKVWEVKRKELEAGGTVTKAQLDKISSKQIIDMVHSLDSSTTNAGTGERRR